MASTASPRVTLAGSPWPQEPGVPEVDSRSPLTMKTHLEGEGPASPPGRQPQAVSAVSPRPTAELAPALPTRPWCQGSPPRKLSWSPVSASASEEPPKQASCPCLTPPVGPSAVPSLRFSSGPKAPLSGGREGPAFGQASGGSGVAGGGVAGRKAEPGRRHLRGHERTVAASLGTLASSHRAGAAPGPDLGACWLHNALLM